VILFYDKASANLLEKLLDLTDCKIANSDVDGGNSGICLMNAVIGQVRTGNKKDQYEIAWAIRTETGQDACRITRAGAEATLGGWRITICTPAAVM
jgi:hypothetical protein